MKASGISFEIKKPLEEIPRLLREHENLEKIELNCC